MAEININGKGYDIDSLSENAKKQIVSLQFVQNEIKRLNSQLAAYKTAEIAYSKAVEESIK
tara:strand:+ start:1705 stop:1887 length:183 start_codon:yes stop_codon:yes gene_type:complete